MSAANNPPVSDYSPIAWFYDRHWSGHYHPWAIAVLEKLLLSRLPAGSSILDVCCGNGIIARDLVERGYRVTGIDTSEEMLRFARGNAPGALFLREDARSFRFKPRFDAAVSTFDSLNHILSPGELLAVFENVHCSLREGGRFVFDVNLEESYLHDWGKTCSTIDDEHACFIRGEYDAASRLGRTEVSLFQRNGAWSRKDVVFVQRFHSIEDIRGLLAQVGFNESRCLNAVSDLGIDGYFGHGRAIFTARKSGGHASPGHEVRV